MKQWYILSSESPGVLRDENGVPVEWTLLSVGANAFCQEGVDGALTLTANDMQQIISYHHKKGELIPVDSEHFLYHLSQQKKLSESETLKMFPGGVAALGFGTLALDDGDLRFKVKWLPAAYDMLKEKIYKYFSPVLRGLSDGNLRITSVAMTNTPAINNLDALAASANKPSDLSGKSGKSDKTGKGSTMTRLEKALLRLTGRDSVALEAEGEEIAIEIEAKADLIEQVKKLLNLDNSATLEEVIAALKAETEKAKSADEKQSKLDELAASAEKEAHSRLVEKGRAERKIVDSDMDYVNSLDSKALSAYLDHAAPKFPAPLPKAKVMRKEDTAVLSAEDHLAIAALRNAGIKDAENLYLKQKKGE